MRRKQTKLSLWQGRWTASRASSPTSLCGSRKWKAARAKDGFKRETTGSGTERRGAAGEEILGGALCLPASRDERTILTDCRLFPRRGFGHGGDRRYRATS